MKEGWKQGSRFAGRCGLNSILTVIADNNLAINYIDNFSIDDFLPVTDLCPKFMCDTNQGTVQCYYEEAMEYNMSDIGNTSDTFETSPTYTSKRKRNAAIALGIAVFAVVVAVAIAVPIALSNSTEEIPTEVPEDNLEHAKQIMKRVPLVDGHNDLPIQLRTRWHNQLSDVNLWDDLPTHTDIPRLREGHVGGQFWSVYIPCNSQYKDSVRQTLDQIDITRRYIEQYNNVFELVTTAQGILDAHADGKIASLIGMEGGHHIDSSFANLRMTYVLGARYMTITHSCNTPWADNSNANENPEFDGLSEWGKDIIREMNRIGMLVDLSHVSDATMHDALDVTQAPVIFSHSASRTLCEHSRNVPDDVLLRLKDNGGIVMVVFFCSYVCTSQGIRCTVQDVADHIEYIASVCGYDCVGIGSDYDGVFLLPVDLEDVSKYPNLVAEMIKRGWSDENIEKLIGLNLVRVLGQTERVRDNMKGVLPYEDFIPRDDSVDEYNNTCRTHSNGWPSYHSDGVVLDDGSENKFKGRVCDE
ncbi:dipeptidase 1-like [Glandiceps talaboti]